MSHAKYWQTTKIASRLRIVRANEQTSCQRKCSQSKFPQYCLPSGSLGPLAILRLLAESAGGTKDVAG